MFFGEYDYDLDMKVKSQEAAEDKAIENARKLLSDGRYTAEEISALLQIPVEAFTEPIKEKA